MLKKSRRFIATIIITITITSKVKATIIDYLFAVPSSLSKNNNNAHNNDLSLVRSGASSSTPMMRSLMMSHREYRSICILPPPLFIIMEADSKYDMDKDHNYGTGLGSTTGSGADTNSNSPHATRPPAQAANPNTQKKKSVRSFFFAGAAKVSKKGGEQMKNLTGRMDAKQRYKENGRKEKKTDGRSSASNISAGVVVVLANKIFLRRQAPR